MEAGQHDELLVKGDSPLSPGLPLAAVNLLLLFFPLRSLPPRLTPPPPFKIHPTPPFLSLLRQTLSAGKIFLFFLRPFFTSFLYFPSALLPSVFSPPPPPFLSHSFLMLLFLFIEIRFSSARPISFCCLLFSKQNTQRNRVTIYSHRRIILFQQTGQHFHCGIRSDLYLT